MKQPKPIFAIGLPFKAHFDNLSFIKEIADTMPDYHVFAYTRESHEMLLQVFDPSNAIPVNDIEELKAKTIQQLNDKI